MDKSYNDIKTQEQRVIATATELWRYRDNKRRCVDIQRIAQITRNTLCQHGIGFFGYDPNEKKPRKIIERPKAEPDRPRLDEKRAAATKIYNKIVGACIARPLFYDLHEILFRKAL